jgi:hypothetical protein
MFDKKMLKILGWSLSIATELLALIFMGLFIGRQLDIRLSLGNPYMTALFCLVALAFGLWRVSQGYKKLISFIDK